MPYFTLMSRHTVVSLTFEYGEAGRRWLGFPLAFFQRVPLKLTLT